MEGLTFSSSCLALLLYIVPLVSAQFQVLSTVIYTNHGERTPMVWIDDPSLTPLGAKQLEQAGINMRNRYVQSSAFGYETSYTIRDISGIFLKNREINILSSADEWVTGSAQAYMQGLYPPLTMGQNYTDIQGESDFWNGTQVIAPLGGYQYSNIAAPSLYDPSSIFVKGTDDCPNYDFAMMDYYRSARYNASKQAGEDFYESLKAPLLDGVFDDGAVGYFDAYYIWDYLSYGYVHNTTIRRKLSDADYVKARLLAGNWMLDMYANTTDGEVGPAHIRAIGGRSFAYYVVNAFVTSIQNGGKVNKMNLVFGDYRPMMSFAALAGLMEEKTGEFFNAPNPGASLIFELFTTDSDPSSLTYPQSTDMFVRFLYKNSSDPDIEPQEFSLFGLSPGNARMTWGEFVAAMSGIMISDVDDWCTACGSPSIFCTALKELDDPSISNKHGLQPAIAGVIGAIVALVFIGLLGAFVMLLGGVRLYRVGKGTSQMGGFKGNEKLASDQDLTIPKGRVGVTVSEEPRGHERVGSWELKEPAQIPNLQSGIDTAEFGGRGHGLDNYDATADPYGIPVKPRDAF